MGGFPRFTGDLWNDECHLSGDDWFIGCFKAFRYGAKPANSSGREGGYRQSVTAPGKHYASRINHFAPIRIRFYRHDPRCGADIAAFVAYNELVVCKTPENFARVKLKLWLL